MLTTQRISLFSDIIKILGPFKRITEGGVLVPTNYEEMKKFDLDLKFGLLGEDFVQDMQNGNNKIEVKTERDIWKTTGNIAIEIRCNGKPSGISTTGSAIWIHLLSYEGKIESGLILPVPQLKARIKELVESKKARIAMGGDFKASQMVLMPIKDAIKLNKPT